MWCSKLVLLFLVAHVVFGKKSEAELENTVYLGGLFDDEAAEDHPSLEELNNFLKQIADGTDLNFQYLEETIEKGNSLDAMLKTCSFLNQRSVAIFGPKNEENINTVQSICDDKDVAHIITRWIYNPRDYSSVVNFYPSAESLTRAYYDVLIKWEWKSFTVLYDNNESLLRVSELIRISKNNGLIVVVRQLSEDGDESYRKALKEALQSGETNYVIDCRIEILEQVLTQAQQVGMMTSHFKYFITNLDMDTIDLEPFQYSDANVTGLRLVNPTNQIIMEYGMIETEIKSLRTETALLLDALRAVVRAVAKIPAVVSSEGNVISCDNFDNLGHGATIANEIITSPGYDGLTGRIEFDNERNRSNFNLAILELHETGTQEIGTWNASKGLTTIRPIGEQTDDDPFSLRNKTFIVMTCLTEPYGMLKETSETLRGNDRFEGFSIDLIHELSLMEGFNYTFKIRADKSNGKKQDNGSWSGMIGDLINHEADLAITDLTITAEREEAVDFTSPFMNLGISILAKKPKKAPPGFFSFADPFALDTWIMLAVAYVIVSLSFFIMGRLCPDEWTNPYPCIEEPEFLINQFSFKNSFWFAVGSLMQQGSEVAPIAISTRMVSGMWWFFVLIMVSSYTANLAAFLATENPINLFTDLDSLVANREDQKIKMGAKIGGATASFFEGKDDPRYKAVAEYMKTHTEDMVGDNKDGVLKAERENYAFFMESTSIEYEIQRHCDLQQYGGLLDDKGYGIAMRKNSTYRKRLSTAILKLQSSGQIDKLKRKWWEERKGGGQCASASESGEATPLGLKNVEGVFYVTIAGTILAIIVVIIEMTLAVWQGSRKAKIPFKEAFRSEMNAYLNFSSDVKPTFQEKSESKSGSGSSPQESGKYNNNLSYGFLPTIIKEPLAEDQ